MKTIKILDEEVNIGFCMAVEIEFEEQAGTGFSVDALKSQKNSMHLYAAAIKVYNEHTSLTFDKLTREASAEEIGELSSAVIDEMLAWMKIPTVIEDKETAAPEQKNA